MTKLDIYNLLSGLNLPADDPALRQEFEDFLRDEIDYDGSGFIDEEEWQNALAYSQQWAKLQNDVGQEWKDSFVERISDRFAAAVMPSDIPDLPFVELIPPADPLEIQAFKDSPKEQTQYIMGLTVAEFVTGFVAVCETHGLSVSAVHVQQLAQALDELDGDMSLLTSTADQQIDSFNPSTLGMALILMSEINSPAVNWMPRLRA